MVMGCKPDSLLQKATVLLLQWQSTGDTRCLDAVVEMTWITLERIVAGTLRRHGIHDTSVVEDVLSLVLDHLRRLPDSPSHGRCVARFDPRRAGCSTKPGDDPAIAFLHWLARDRALDVVRAHYRRSHRVLAFSGLDDSAARCLQASLDPDGDDEEGRLTEVCIRLHEAIKKLEPRLRTVIDMLLDGKSQAVIAHVLNICEGTVSRLRCRAIEELQRLTAEQGE